MVETVGIYIKKRENMMICKPKDNETYKEYINRILSFRKNSKDDKAYMERHHIILKTLGGKNESDNLIWLYAEEHYYSHKLLALENPENAGLQIAWWNMCHCAGRGGKREFVPSAQDYATARKRFAEYMKGENNPQYGHNGEKSEWYGKTHSIESRQKISKARKAQPKKQKKIPTIIFSDETKEKMSKNHYDCNGKNNPRARKVRCIETNMIFDTAKEAGEYYKLTPSNPGSTIRRACSTGRTSGFDGVPLHWEYIE